MEKNSKIYLAGHNGVVGTAILNTLIQQGYNNIVTTQHMKYDLTNQIIVNQFFKKQSPEYVILSAGKVGGIWANKTYPANFIYDNIMIAANIIHASYTNKVKKLIYLGAGSIYPKNCQQPILEQSILSGQLQQSNYSYSIAKLCGISLCKAYNNQYNTNFISAILPNIYGPNDKFNLQTSHVFPSMLRKIHLSYLLQNNKYDEIIQDIKINDNIQLYNNLDILSYLNKYGIYKIQNTVNLKLWGTGKPYREFLYSYDLADGIIFLMNNYNENYHINISTSEETQIVQLALVMKQIIKFNGNIL